MSGLRSALNHFYNALLNDEPSNVQKSYNAAINALIDIYGKKGGDKLMTGHDTEKLKLLANALCAVAVAGTVNERYRTTEYCIKAIESLGKHFVGTKAQILAFLKKVKKNVNKTKYFTNIELSGIEIINGNVRLVDGQQVRLDLMISQMRSTTDYLEHYGHLHLAKDTVSCREKFNSALGLLYDDEELFKRPKKLK